MLNLRRKWRTPTADVVIEVANADELFYADPSGLLAGARRIDSGMDELVERPPANTTSSGAKGSGPCSAAHCCSLPASGCRIFSLVR